MFHTGFTTSLKFNTALPDKVGYNFHLSLSEEVEYLQIGADESLKRALQQCKQESKPGTRTRTYPHWQWPSAEAEQFCCQDPTGRTRHLLLCNRVRRVRKRCWCDCQPTSARRCPLALVQSAGLNDLGSSLRACGLVGSHPRLQHLTWRMCLKAQPWCESLAARRGLLCSRVRKVSKKGRGVSAHRWHCFPPILPCDEHSRTTKICLYPSSPRTSHRAWKEAHVVESGLWRAEGGVQLGRCFEGDSHREYSINAQGTTTPF